MNNTEYGLFCVFDGHAGHACAIKAKDSFTQIFADHVTAFWKQNPNAIDLTSVFLSALGQLDTVALKKFEFEGSTATCCFMFQRNGKRYLQCANLGDSEAFLQRKDSVLPLTEEHKPSNPKERQRILDLGIDLAENATRLHGMAVSRALGDHYLKNPMDDGEAGGMSGVPYISPVIELNETDSGVILASDGVRIFLFNENSYGMLWMENKLFLSVPLGILLNQCLAD
jgi:serine/threonine protein phosphatase PrpC